MDTIREYLYPIAVGRLRGLRLPGPLQRLHEDTAGLMFTASAPRRSRMVYIATAPFTVGHGRIKVQDSSYAAVSDEQIEAGDFAPLREGTLMTVRQASRSASAAPRAVKAAPSASSGDSDAAGFRPSRVQPDPRSTHLFRRRR